MSNKQRATTLASVTTRAAVTARAAVGIPAAWGVLAVWCVLALMPHSMCAAPTPKTPAHVVLVVWGGGIHMTDFAHKEAMPVLAAMARAGRVVDNVQSDASDGLTAVARLLTGASEPGVDLATTAPSEPTLCEYLRAGRRTPAEDTWYVAFDASAARRESCSTHPSYGAAFAPRIAYGAGSVGEPLKTFLRAQGRPLPLQPGAFTLLSKLRTLNRASMSGALHQGVRNAGAVFERVERALLNELDAKAALVRGPNPGDERAWRAAQTVLRIHEPLLTIIRLGEAEVGDQNPAKYRAVMRANDRALGRLRAHVAATPGLKDQTLFVLVPDRPRTVRDSALVAGPGAVSVVVTGPGAKRWRPTKGPRRLEDIGVTIGAVLGVPTPEASGRSWLR